MPQYEWYFVNKDDDVSICKHVTYKITFVIYMCAVFNISILFLFRCK